MPTTKQRVDAMEASMAEHRKRQDALEARIQALDQRLNKAAEIVQATHKQQEALGRRMDQIASRMEQLVQDVDRRLATMEKALAAAGITNPTDPEDERRRRLHARLREEARRLSYGPNKLARALGIPVRTVSHWLKGDVTPRSQEHLAAIVDWLESTQWLTPED
ncbi:MAG: helix-turn-helix transcriptional regulator [bacterium]|nr:helix-turn-helix transcriptional regulator [bacterium]